MTLLDKPPVPAEPWLLLYLNVHSIPIYVLDISLKINYKDQKAHVVDA